jgi:predicted nucleic acid-binding protein
MAAGKTTPRSRKGERGSARVGHALLGPSRLRTLDAIHLAGALALGDALERFVAYDRRMLAAAASRGLPTASPGA